MQFLVNNILILIVVAVMFVIYRRVDSPARLQARIRRTSEREQDAIINLVEEKAQRLKNMAVEIEVQQQTVRAILQKSKDLEEGIDNRLQSMGQVDHRIKALEERFNVRLQSFDRIEDRIQEYENVLKDLAAMTANVEENLRRLHQESKYVDSVGNRLGELQKLAKEIEQKSSTVLDELHSTNTAHMQELEEKVYREFDTHSASLKQDYQESAQAVQGIGSDIEVFRKEMDTLQDSVLYESERRLKELIDEQSTRVIGDVRAQFATELEDLDNIRQELEGKKQELSSFAESLPATMQKNHQSIEERVYNNLDKRLSDFEQDLIYRMTKLDVLRQDIDLLDKEMRDSIEQVATRLQEQFNSIPERIDSHRKELLAEIQKQGDEIRADVAEIMREVNSVKSRAHMDLSTKIDVLSKEFLGNLGEKSDALRMSLEEFQAEFSERLRTLEVGHYAKLSEQEQELTGSLTSMVDSLRMRVQEQLDAVESSTTVMHRNISERNQQAGEKLHLLAQDYELHLNEAKQNAHEHIDSQFQQYDIEMRGKLRKHTQDTDAIIQQIAGTVDNLDKGVTSRVLDMEQSIQQVRQQFQTQSAGMFEELEEHKIAFREEMRGIINDARDQFFAQRHKLISKLEQNIRGLEDTLAKIDKRQKDFVEQTKLFTRVESMRTDLHEHLGYYKEELEHLEQSRVVVRELEQEIEKIQHHSRNNARKLAQLNEEKQRIELLEGKYRGLATVSHEVERQFAEINQKSDELQGLQSRFKHIEILEKDLGDRLERLDKKRAVIDVTIKTIDSNFSRLSELDSRINDISSAVDNFATDMQEVSSSIQLLSKDKEQVNKAVEMLKDLDGGLSNLEERLQEVRTSREWLARSETRFEHLNTEVDEQLTKLEHIVRGELKEYGAKKEAHAPSRDAQKTVLDLAKRGWSVTEIARVTHISKGEVELIMEISSRT